MSFRYRINFFFFLFLFAAFCGAGCSIFAIELNDGTEHSYSKDVFKEELSRSKGISTEISSSEADYNFMLGELSLYDEQFAEAEKYFEKAAKLEKSSSPTLCFRLAQIYLRSGRLPESLEQANKALEVDPENIELLKIKAGVLATLKRNTEAVDSYLKIIALAGADNEDAYIFAASLLAQDDKLEDAKKILYQLLEKKPHSFFGIYYLAKVMFALGDFSQSEKYYKKALELTPDAETVLLELAHVYAVQKRFNEAIKICEDIVQKNPSSVKGRAFLGELLLSKDRVEDAIKEYEAIGSLEQDPSETRYKIGLIKLQKRDFEGAEVEFRLVLSQHPDNSSARYYLASTYAAMNRFTEAVEQLEYIKSADELFTQSRTLAVFLLRESKNYPKALDMLEQLIKQKPDNVKLLLIKSSLLHDAKRIQEAIEILKEVIKLKPNDDANYFALGVYYDEVGARKLAMDAMKKAVEINPKNANALNYIGYSWAEKSENLQEAEQYVKRALAIELDNGYFIDSLGWVYYKMERYEDAYIQLNKAVEIVKDDAVILEHFAIACMKRGEKNKAIEILKRAEKQAPESDDKNVGERIKKLLDELGAASK